MELCFRFSMISSSLLANSRLNEVDGTNLVVSDILCLGRTVGRAVHGCCIGLVCPMFSARNHVFGNGNLSNMTTQPVHGVEDERPH